MIHRRLPADGWRMFALVAVFVNVIFNYVSMTSVVSLPSLEDISHRYSSLFTPHDYAFSIWGLIYLSFIVYAIVQAMPSRTEDPLYRNLAKPFAIVNFLATVWIITFRMQLMWLSAGIIVAMLVISIFMLVLSRDAVSRSSDFPYVSAVAVVAAVLPMIWIATTVLKRIQYRRHVLQNRFSF